MSVAEGITSKISERKLLEESVNKLQEVPYRGIPGSVWASILVKQGTRVPSSEITSTGNRSDTLSDSFER